MVLSPQTTASLSSLSSGQAQHRPWATVLKDNHVLVATLCTGLVHNIDSHDLKGLLDGNGVQGRLVLTPSSHNYTLRTLLAIG